jgi:selenocysteine lyase/cysteine desulfurase
VLEIIALGASCQALSAVGVPAVGARATELARRLVDGCRGLGIPVHSPHGENWRGAIVNLGTGNLDRLGDALRRAGVSFARRGPGLRLSPHAFNVETDIDRALDALDGCRGVDAG